ncbi:MAG TPA: carboxymuconolactone decarboxylase family protein [Thermoanaerobaculia bacterium]|nr:carboxymuconolactone decarboxylase family protein [Thermoanaerobaculia bacterium]
MAASWVRLEQRFYDSPLLPAQLKEQVQRTLAQRTGCESCKALGSPEGTPADVKTSLAVGFATAVAASPAAEVTDAQFDVWREEFSEAETAELVAFVSFMIGAQTFGALMRLQA